MEGLTEIKSGRSPAVRPDPRDTDILVPERPQFPAAADRAINAAADNLPQILSIAEDLVELQKIRVQSEAVIKQMQEQRKMLTAEAEAYAKKKNADTKDVVDKMNVVRAMMNDYYQYSGNSNISGEDFRMIISDIVMNMNKVSNG